MADFRTVEEEILTIPPKPSGEDIQEDIERIIDIGWEMYHLSSEVAELRDGREDLFQRFEGVVLSPFEDWVGVADERKFGLMVNSAEEYFHNRTENDVREASVRFLQKADFFAAREGIAAFDSRVVCSSGGESGINGEMADYLLSGAYEAKSVSRGKATTGRLSDIDETNKMCVLLSSVGRDM